MTATAADDSVTLRWTSPGDLTIDKYRYRQTTATTDSGGNTVGDFSAAPWLLIEGSGSGTIEHEVTELTVGTLYYFQIQAASPYGDSDPSDDASARPVPVRGEWTFEATIDPNPLETGDPDGATVGFRAVYTVTSGTATDLSFAITGDQPTITTSLSKVDGGNVGIGSAFVATRDSIVTRQQSPTETVPTCDPTVNVAQGTIVCDFPSLATVFAKDATTPDRYGLTISLSDGLTFEARASTGTGPDDGHKNFPTAFADDDDVGMLNLESEIVPGVPAAPINLVATGSSSRVTLEWADPGNPNITGYQYQQTTTAPGAPLRWTPGGSEGVRYQYRRTTTEPGIVLSWSIPSGLLFTDSVTYEYQWTTVADTSDPSNPVPDFSDSTWETIPGSDVGTTSHKVTGLDMSETHYFQVRPVKDGTAQSNVDSLTTTVEYFNGVDWTDIPDSGAGEANQASYKVTGFDIRESQYFEVRAVNAVQVGDTIAATGTGSVTLNWDAPDPADSTITNWQYRRSADGNFQPDGSDWTLLDPADPSATSISLTGVDLTSANHYQVRPYRTDTGGDPVEVTIDVALSWTDPSESTIERFQYRQSTDGGNTWSPWSDIDGSGAATTTHTAEDIDLRVVHTFEVRGVKEDGGDPMTPDLGGVDNFGDAGDWEDIPNSTPGEANALSYDVTGLGNGETYYFRIRADTTKTVDGGTVGGPGGVSNTKSATTMLAAPVAPTGLTATPSSSVTEVKLLWTDPGDSDITGWEYRYTSAWQAVLTWDVDAAATGWEYHHSVDGGNNYGEWKDSGIIEADAATATTATITGVNRALSNMFEVRPVKAGGDQPAVTTGQTISGDFTGIDTWTTITESSATTTEHTVPGLDLNNNFYFFEVRPVRGEVSGDVVDLNQEQQLGSVTLSWDDPGDSTITKYQYHLTETKISGTSETVVGPSEWLDIPEKGKVTGLKALEHDYTGSSGLVSEYDFVYTIKIRAMNNSGDMGAEASGPESDEVKANPGLPLAAPKNVTASYNPATGAFTIGWDAYNSALFKPDFEVLGTGPDGVSLRATAVTVLGDSPVIPDSVEIVTDLFGDFTFVVRAREDFGPWAESDTVEATASPFAEASLTREVGDTAAAGANVGKPVTVAATGYDVSYSLKGDSGRIFSINRDTGQITLAIGGPAADEYPIVVEASLSKGGARRQSSIEVTVTVTSSGPWVELGKVTPIGSDNDRAGNAVAVDEGTGIIVVGAKAVGTSGRVYVYESLHDFTPAILEPSDTPTEFGVTVAVGGDNVVVGSKSSKVYVFTKPATTAGWPDDNTAMTETAILTPSDTATGDGFGEAVAFSGDTVVVGAAIRDETGADDIGGAYVFVEPETGGWVTATETATLQGPSTGEAGIIRAAGDFFGRSVAIDGDNVVIGAPGKETAYLFVKPDGVDGWTGAVEPTATLNGEGTVDGDGFGWSIDIDGGTIVVGEHQNTTGPGAAYVFTGSGSNWTQLTEFSGLGVGLGEVFGYSVAVSGDYIAVARRKQPDNKNTGSVEVFQKSDTAATPYVLLASDGGLDDRFGQAFTDNAGIYDGRPIAMDGDLLVVGATGDDERGNNMGAAYLFSPVTRPDVSGGVYELGSAYTDTTVTSRDGDTRVTIPSGAVPTATRYFQQVTRFSGCSGITGRTVHDCISVQLYDLGGTPIRFDDDTRLKHDHEAVVTLSKPSTGSFRVFKRNAPGERWEEVYRCPRVGETGECYNRDDNNGNVINIGGITSFSQYAVTTASRPSRPGAPGDLVADPGNRQVTLTWTAPSPTGGSAIIGYDYSLDRGTNWNGIPGSDRSTRSYTVTNLRNGITYQFAVRARNSAGPGARSNIVHATPRSRGRDVSPGRARGGGSATSHVPPTFDEGASTTRRIAENSPTGTRIGGPLVARDPLERRVLYTKGGPDADLFDVASQTGQIYVRRGTVLDYESGRKTFLIDVVGNTGVGGPGKIAVTIIVTNVPEPGSVVLSPDTPPEVGAEITAALSDPDGGINGVSWQWQRSSDGRTWNDIPGATSASYTPTEADRGMMLRASVSYNDAAATGINLVSMATGAVPERTPVLDLPGSVTLSPEGAPEVGTKITATLIDPDGGVTGETWQWQRSVDGVTWTAIDGASTASYTPVESDVGMMLRANVSYSDAVAAGVSLLSATTEAVAAMPAPDRPGSVTLSPEGTPEIGKAITATVTDPDGEVTGEIWQWQRSADGVTWTDIDGATTEKYTPTEADAGMVLRPTSATTMRLQLESMRWA